LTVATDFVTGVPWQGIHRLECLESGLESPDSLSFLGSIERPSLPSIPILTDLFFDSYSIFSEIRELNLRVGVEA
jgi:hypothetical protein